MNNSMRIWYHAAVILFMHLFSNPSCAQDKNNFDQPPPRDMGIVSSQARLDDISKMSGNKDRGLRIVFKAMGPGKVSIDIPNNGEQQHLEVELKPTNGRWADVVMEADIFHDEAVDFELKSSVVAIEQISSEVIEAAANRHYGDNIRVTYDRDLHLQLLKRDDLAASAISYNGRVIFDSSMLGEFTAIFETSNHEHVETVEKWQPSFQDSTLSLDKKKLEMVGTIDMKTTTGSVVDVKVTYEVLTNHVIKKTIDYNLVAGHAMFTSLDSYIGAENPDSFWAWNMWEVKEDTWRDIWKGTGDFDSGCDSIPAIGYRVGDVSVGMLSDSGFRNQWSRTYGTWNLNGKEGERDNIGNKNLLDLELYGAFPSEKKAGFRLGKIYYRSWDKVASYHQLHPNSSSSKTFYIVVDEDLDNVRKLRMALQTNFADGKGFKGSIPEKILYADMEMLTGVFDPLTLESYVHPSPHYDMIFARDAFWSASALYEKDLSIQVFNMLFRTSEHMTNDCMRPFVWRKDNVGHFDGTLMSIIWAYVNFKRYGYLTPEIVQKIERIIDAEHRVHTNREPGIYYANTGGWLDVYFFAEPVNFSNMQGQYLAALKCAKALGAKNVTDEEIAQAAQGYRSFYNKEKGYMLLSRDAKIWRYGEKIVFPFSQSISPSALTGEFLNLWLFGDKILDDEAVVATLDKLDAITAKRWADGYVLPNVIQIDGSRYTRKNKPYFDAGYWEEGIYHNGGSWMLYEQMAYAVGHFHNWRPAFVGKSAKHRIAKRLELDLSEKDQPVSQEFLPLTERGINTHGSVWDGRADNNQEGPAGAKVFAWNAFTRVILEMVGMRPVEDPIIKAWQ